MIEQLNERSLLVILTSLDLVDFKYSVSKESTVICAMEVLKDRGILGLYLHLFYTKYQTITNNFLDIPIPSQVLPIYIFSCLAFPVKLGKFEKPKLA